ncbi:MAG: hypothetical protein K9L68_10845, partial [Spirochaetales bacterium]|nr:hypothetical protein [Spirochaetales bacterium]MCF7939082.1 hypothetical protein [Spirochaetales bacterium]
RSARGFNVHELLKAGSDLFLDSGGHDFAAGFSISAEHIDALRERFATFSAEMNLDGEEEERLEIDAELPPAYVDSRIGRIIDYFGPYGEQNPPVTFLSRGMEVGSIDLVGSGNEHVKMLVQPAGGSGKERFPALYWNAADKINGKLKPGSRIDLVYRVEWNFFQQTKTLQFVILDMHFGDEHHEENKI